ncbi:uncharacterized protein BCR38DRAFT_175942 [Pseudomassariella vexata]|uniref:Uncharacterized protein n=1 Tax=Pseudomassariella vexata TaxID=1141098 RepID=A0A1Y2E3X2_9PEZI|nr:uncharacterized protein BCR38DRAFT_175942 [Pseudomassariella vexata]ORY66258.1 hypothetical protein BCR38DRAFT_175942 [Pseudomassariella vexata]
MPNYQENFTRDRPPHLNHTNFPSAQSSGPLTEPESIGAEDHMERMHLAQAETDGDHDRYPPSLGSGNTDSTMKDKGVETPVENGVDQYIQRRNHVLYFISNDPLNLNPPLTVAALQALNHGNGQYHHQHVYQWCQNGYFPVAVANTTAGISESLMVSRRSQQAQSHATEASSVAVSTRTYPAGERITGAGFQFDEMPAPARSLKDDDLYDYEM